MCWNFAYIYITSAITVINITVCSAKCPIQRAVASTSSEMPTMERAAELSRLARLQMLNDQSSKALEKLDKMVEDISVNDLPGMCSFSFGRPPTCSRSDGQICPNATKR